MSIDSSMIATEGQQNGNLASWNNSNTRNEETGTTSGNRQNEQTTVCCFVCDGQVQGRRYTLATCKTQSSGSRVIEKLGELVGERYVVVISEDDVICRSCANLINTLDRLEAEMKVSKAAVLRFLEHKYCLAEGELVNDSVNSVGVSNSSRPPQITRTHDYHSRKRGAPVFIGDVERARKKKKKPAVWMQCDKCRYTTLYDTFMVRHVRRHAERRINCDKCGIEFPDNSKNQEIPNHDCPNKENNEIAKNFVKPKNRPKDPQIIHTNVLDPIDSTAASTTTEQNFESLVCSELSMKEAEPIPTIDATSSEDFKLQTVPTIANEVVSSLSSSSNVEEAIFVRVLQQQLAEDHNSVIPTEFTNTPDQIDATVNEINNGEGTATRQMLTLAEDGSLEMVSVDCWNNSAHSRDTDTDIIPF